MNPAGLSEPDYLRRTRVFYIQLAQERQYEIGRLRRRVAELEAAARDCLDEVRGTMAYCPATDALAALVAGEAEQP